MTRNQCILPRWLSRNAVSTSFSTRSRFCSCSCSCSCFGFCSGFCSGFWARSSFGPSRGAGEDPSTADSGPPAGDPLRSGRELKDLLFRKPCRLLRLLSQDGCQSSSSSKRFSQLGCAVLARARCSAAMTLRLLLAPACLANLCSCRQRRSMRSLGGGEMMRRTSKAASGSAAAVLPCLRPLPMAFFVSSSLLWAVALVLGLEDSRGMLTILLCQKRNGESQKCPVM